MVQQRFTGEIKFWNRIRGFGFITLDNATDDEPDVFIHYAQAIAGTSQPRINFEEGEALEFDIENEGKGPRAINIKRLRRYAP